LPDQQAELIAAARAAASWARTRRATWTDAPLPVLARASPEQIPVAAPTRTGPSLAARAAAGLVRLVHLCCNGCRAWQR